RLALAHGVPVSPRAGRLAVRPTGRTPAAGRLTRWSCLGLGARQQTLASRCETLPRWARDSESRPAVQRERGESFHFSSDRCSNSSAKRRSPGNTLSISALLAR